MWEMEQLILIFAAAVMFVLMVGCSKNNAEVEQLRKELDENQAATPIGATTPAPTPTLGATAQADADGDVIDVIELGGGNGEGCEQWDVERERLD